MVATKIAAGIAKACMHELVKSRRLMTICFSHALAAAKSDITLPFYLDLTFPCPILSIRVADHDTTAVNEVFGYSLINELGTSDQCTAPTFAALGAGEFAVCDNAGAVTGKIIILGDATTDVSLYQIQGVFRDFK
jgi:hypothetical protein